MSGKDTNKKREHKKSKKNPKKKRTDETKDAQQKSDSSKARGTLKPVAKHTPHKATAASQTEDSAGKTMSTITVVLDPVKFKGATLPAEESIQPDPLEHASTAVNVYPPDNALIPPQSTHANVTSKQTATKTASSSSKQSGGSIDTEASIAGSESSSKSTKSSKSPQ